MAHFPTCRTSAAPEFIDLSATAGLKLDPWQRFVLTGGLGERDDGRAAAAQVGCWVPRQNGKGGICEALELGWLFLTHEPLIMHSAHEYKTSQEAFLRIKFLIENCPDLDRRVNRYWQANGEQGIELTRRHGGARLRFLARSRTSGRGFTGSKNIGDEAQELAREQMAALLPTMSAVDDPQVWFFGTPPRDGTAWCYLLKNAGEAGAAGVAWFDWGAALDLAVEADRARLGDRDLWYECNPAMGIRVRESFVAGVELAGLGLDFAAERLGVWPAEVVGDGGGVISAEAWAALADPGSKRVGDVAFAVDVNPARTHTSIAAWGRREDGRGHAELVEYRPGTEWVAGRCAGLRERHAPVAFAVDVRSAAGSLVDELEGVGITRPVDVERPHPGCLVVPSTAEVAAACGQLLDAVTQGGFAHIGQAQLTAAALGAKTRPVGEAAAFGRRVSAVDISPLVAVTLARWAFETAAAVFDISSQVF